MNSLIFDLDGTLWNSCETVAKAWNMGFAKSNISKSLNIQDIEGTMGLAFSEIFDKLLPGLSSEKQKEIGYVCEGFENKLIQESGGYLYPKVKELIPELAKTHKLFIVSNCQKGYIEAFFKHSGLGEYFTDFLSHGATGRPKGENIKTLMQKNNCENSLYIGDTVSDWKGATFAAIPLLFAEWGFGDLEQLPRKASFSSFESLAMALLSDSNLYF